jgi:hypothetical protein
VLTTRGRGGADHQIFRARRDRRVVLGVIMLRSNSANILEEPSEADQARNAWQKAAELLMSAAEEKTTSRTSPNKSNSRCSCRADGC